MKETGSDMAKKLEKNQKTEAQQKQNGRFMKTDGGLKPDVNVSFYSKKVNI